jgi:hypothetical protein
MRLVFMASFLLTNESPLLKPGIDADQFALPELCLYASPPLHFAILFSVCWTVVVDGTLTDGIVLQEHLRSLRTRAGPNYTKFLSSQYALTRITNLTEKGIKRQIKYTTFRARTQDAISIKYRLTLWSPQM